MDFPPIDLTGVFAFDSVVIDPSLVDPMPTTTASDASGPDERLPTPQTRQNTPQPSDVDARSKLGVCSSCRRKKRRCNLERPTCSLCRINGWTCEYLHVKKRPGPPRGLVSRPSTLSSRLEVVEALVASRAKAPSATRLASGHNYIEVASSGQCTEESRDRSTDSPITVAAEAALAIPTITAAAPSPATTEQVLDLSENMTAILISLYFDNVQPIFPLFRRAVFQTDLREDKVPQPLLYIMLALASRYVLPSEMLQTFGQNVIEPWEYFARVSFKKSRFNEENDSSSPISLEDVKTLFLLTLHEYTSFPGRKAWMRVGNTVRAAISAGLHRIEQPNQGLVSEAEIEERRFTWWAVWRVDSSINMLASSPFNIETRDLHTALPSTSVANFTCGVISPCSFDYLPADTVKAWRSIHDLQRILSKESSNLYFHTVSYNRQAMTCRRRLFLHPTLELTSEFNNLKQILPYLRVALPPRFLSGARQLTGETIDEHRQRIETLILLYITEVILYLPIRELDFDSATLVQQKCLAADWQICIDSIKEMAALLRHWEPHYSNLTDPLISCVIWISSSILILHTMSISYQHEKRSDDGDSVQDSLELLTTALEGFSRYWPIASQLSESLRSLLSWNWLSLSFQDVLSIASQFQAPIDPEAQDPAMVNIWPVLSNHSQKILQDLMYLE